MTFRADLLTPTSLKSSFLGPIPAVAPGVFIALRRISDVRSNAVPPKLVPSTVPVLACAEAVAAKTVKTAKKMATDTAAGRTERAEGFFIVQTLHLID
jgi:hypothetical protein